MQISVNQSKTIEDEFSDFLISKKALGVTAATLSTYKNHFSAISHHLDVRKKMSSFSKSDLEKMICSLQDSGISKNSIKSYSVSMKAFISWCNAENISSINFKVCKGEETIKEPYNDEELTALLKKPNLNSCEFAEYRSYVVINFLVNCGCRAGTLRNIQNRDVHLENGIVVARHTKNKKPLVIPLCSEIAAILKEYMQVRKGEPTDYLFCNESGTQISERGLASSIKRYNARRGVEKSSVHLFRHTFAKKYLMDCGGNAFTLQKILGHSTLTMTKHYCAIYDSDLTRNYDMFSPLSQMKASSVKTKEARDFKDNLKKTRNK